MVPNRTPTLSQNLCGFPLEPHWSCCPHCEPQTRLSQSPHMLPCSANLRALAHAGLLPRMFSSPIIPCGNGLSLKQQLTCSPLRKACSNPYNWTCSLPPLNLLYFYVELDHEPSQEPLAVPFPWLQQQLILSGYAAVCQITSEARDFAFWHCPVHSRIQRLMFCSESAAAILGSAPLGLLPSIELLAAGLTPCILVVYTVFMMFFSWPS